MYKKIAKHLMVENIYIHKYILKHLKKKKILHIFFTISNGFIFYKFLHKHICKSLRLKVLSHETNQSAMRRIRTLHILEKNNKCIQLFDKTIKKSNIYIFFFMIF